MIGCVGMIGCGFGDDALLGRHLEVDADGLGG